MSNDNLKTDSPSETVKESVARLNALVLETHFLIAATYGPDEDSTYALPAVAFMVREGHVWAICKVDGSKSPFETTARAALKVITFDGEKVYDYFQRENSSSKS